MRGTLAAIVLLLICSQVQAFIPGADGPIFDQEALEGGSSSLRCDARPDAPDDKFMVLVWYKNTIPIYSFDAREGKEWISESYHGRLAAMMEDQPSTLALTGVRSDDQALYHCRVDFDLAPTRNLGINLTVTVLPSQPFFLDKNCSKMDNKTGPHHEGDTLVVSCLVIGGHPPPRIYWYAGETLIDDTDGPSEIPGVKENKLYLSLERYNAGELTCRATNTQLAPPIVAKLEVELYLPSYNVSIHWEEGAANNTLQAGRPALVTCRAIGSYPEPELFWWLNDKHLTQHSNQTWSKTDAVAVSFLQLTPTAAEDGATLACVATTPKLSPAAGARADVIKLHVTFSPRVEVNRAEDARGDVVELSALQLECDVRANPPATSLLWYFNDELIQPGDIWGDSILGRTLLIEETTRHHAGRYSCAAENSLGRARAEAITITVAYPPECTERGITVSKETVHCNVRALPTPDTYLWDIQPSGLEAQHLTTGSPKLPLSQVTGPLAGPVKVSCEAGNGIASQDEPCVRTISLEHLRPQPPLQCDLAYEYKQFQMRCIPVENATYYEVTVWRMSTSNSSLVLEHRGSMGPGEGFAAASGGGPWLVRGALGALKRGDEAGAASCNRYGCSQPIVLKPTDILLTAAAPAWWQYLMDKDVGIAVGAVVLVVVFVVTSLLAVRAARRSRGKPPPPVIQVLQLDDVARDYLDTLQEHKIRASCSLRSCSSVYSDNSVESAPPVDRRRKPRIVSQQWDVPPPDVTLTLHRESAV